MSVINSALALKLDGVDAVRAYMDGVIVWPPGTGNRVNASLKLKSGSTVTLTVSFNGETPTSFKVWYSLNSGAWQYWTEKTAAGSFDYTTTYSTKIKMKVEAYYSGYAPDLSAITNEVSIGAAPPPPVSSGSVNGPALSSSGGWTQSTPRTLNGPTFNISGWVTSFNVYIGGYNGTGAFNPWVGSTRLGWRDVPNGKAYRHVDGKQSNGQYVQVSGSVRLGADAGGTGRPATAWQTYSGAVWNYNVAIGTVNYSWYTRDARGRSAQADQPWWRPEYEGVDIHVESWVDETGECIRAVVHDKATGDVIGTWSRDQPGSSR